MNKYSAGNIREKAVIITKVAAPALAVLAFVYIFIVPIAWPFFKPHVSISMPASWSYNEDLPVQIKVRAAHSNFVIQQVRITYPYNQSNPAQTPYPEVLHSEPPRDEWSMWKINRLTWPASKRLSVTVPLAKLAGEGKIAHGKLAGEIQIRVDYVRGIGRFYALAGKIRSRTINAQIPYSVILE